MHLVGSGWMASWLAGWIVMCTFCDMDDYKRNCRANSLKRKTHIRNEYTCIRQRECGAWDTLLSLPLNWISIHHTCWLNRCALILIQPQAAIVWSICITVDKEKNKSHLEIMIIILIMRKICESSSDAQAYKITATTTATADEVQL